VAICLRRASDILAIDALFSVVQVPYSSLGATTAVTRTRCPFLKAQSMQDLFQNPDDSMSVEPNELGPLFAAVLTSNLAKDLAGQHETPWTDAQEERRQEEIAALVAAARERGLKTIRVIVTRPSGQKATRELDVERILATRSLQ